MTIFNKLNPRLSLTRSFTWSDLTYAAGDFGNLLVWARSIFLAEGVAAQDQALNGNFTGTDEEERAFFARLTEGATLVRYVGSEPDASKLAEQCDPRAMCRGTTAQTWAYLLPFRGLMLLARNIPRQYSVTLVHQVGNAEAIAYYERLRATLLTETTSEEIEAIRRRVYVLTSGMHGFSMTELGDVSLPLEQANYDEDVLAAFERVKAELLSATPTGRLVILRGEPGSGKSYFLRGLIESLAGAIFLYVPTQMLAQLADPGLIRWFIQIKEKMQLPVVLLLEDAEQALSTRMGDNISQIQTLLNFADGLLGELLDIRILATTNAHKTEFDRALLRTGRLLELVDVKQPTPARARAILSRLVPSYEGDLPPEVKTLSDIYSHARTLGWTPPPVDLPASRKALLGKPLKAFERGAVFMHAEPMGFLAGQ